MIPTLVAKGHRGSWYAEVEGERLPCVHSPNMHGTTYKAFWPGDEPHNQLLVAIEAGKKVILRKSKRNDDDSGWVSSGYVGLFSVKDVKVEEDRLTFEFVERLANLK